MSKKQVSPFRRHPTKTRGVSFRIRQGNVRTYAVSWKGSYITVEGGEAEAVAMQAQLRAGLSTPPEKKTDAKSFEDVANAWHASKRKLRNGTADAYRGTIDNRLIPKFGSYGIDAITVDDLASWIIEMEEEGRKPKTITKYTQPMRSILAYAKRKGFRKDNPWLDLTEDDLPDPGVTKPPYEWSEEEAQTLIAAAKARASLPLQKPGSGALFRSDHTDLVRTSLFLGLRQGEALGLQFQDLDLKGSNPVVHVRRQLVRGGTYGPTKTPSSVRDVELTPDTVEMFSEIRKRAFAKGQAGPEAPVFATRDGKPLGHRNVSRDFLKIRADAGLDVKWHDMRDYLASKLIYEGVPAPDVAKRMGHKDASVTLKVYAAQFNKAQTSEKVREAMAK